MALLCKAMAKAPETKWGGEEDKENGRGESAASHPIKCLMEQVVSDADRGKRGGKEDQHGAESQGSAKASARKERPVLEGKAEAESDDRREPNRDHEDETEDGTGASYHGFHSATWVP